MYYSLENECIFQNFVHVLKYIVSVYINLMHDII